MDDILNIHALVSDRLFHSFLFCDFWIVLSLGYLLDYNRFLSISPPFLHLFTSRNSRNIFGEVLKGRVEINPVFFPYLFFPILFFRRVVPIADSNGIGDR